MKKTHSTNIGGRIFEVEEDAYQELTTYLVSIGARFQSYPDAKDIVVDIEARIAEHLLLNAGVPRIVTRDDVARVIVAMGSVDQFGDTTEVPTISRGATSGVATPGIARPRLFRDPDERVIAGVAAGIAAYFDVSPTWTRLVFLVSLFIGGSGLLVYLALWLCVPRARTLTDRVRMRGERVTLDTIDQGLRDESLAVLPKRSSTAQTIFRILIACTVIASLLLTEMCISAIGSEGATWSLRRGRWFSLVHGVDTIVTSP